MDAQTQWWIRRRSEQRLTKLENAIRQMFADMNRAFSTVHFDSSRRGVECGVRNYLKMFDAIFTLNQDVLMEQHYFNSGFARDEFSMYRQWAGWQIPGMQPIPAEGEQPHKMTWVPLDSAKFVLEKDRQPYFKLHGASTWICEPVVCYGASGSGLPVISGVDLL